VPFKLGGFSGFLNKDANFLYFGIQPSNELIQFRSLLSKQLVQYHPVVSNTCTPFDKSSKFTFHSTIGKFPPGEKEKFAKLLDFTKTQCRIEDFNRSKSTIFGKLLLAVWGFFINTKENNTRILLHLLRVTILGKKSHIRCEYDLVLKRSLSRREALSRYWNKRTFERFKEIKKQYS
jgi:hypothetical protein